jgi:branched-chain amino acid transport system permease protein
MALNGALSGRLIDIGGIVVLVVAIVLMGRLIVPRGLPYFVQILSFGVADGAIYALVALGYTMVYGIIELINFAHGDVFTLGAFISLSFLPALGIVEGKPFDLRMAGALVLVTLIAMMLCAIVNVLIERIAYRPLRNAPRLAPLITAIGMSAALEGVMFIWRGPYNLHYPDVLPHSRLPLIAGVTIGVGDVIAIGIAALLVIVFTVFINQSKLGKAMRATAQDRDAAQLMGIDINFTIAATFFIGALLAGAGGVIYGLHFNTITAFTGFQAGLIAFTAAVFGGIGNIPGAAIGGLLIGIIFSMSDGYIGSGEWSEIVVYAILIGTLVFRPTGLLGMRVPEK